MLFTITFFMSSTILKLRMGLVIFLNIICSHEFIVGYPFFYFCCAGIKKQKHWEQAAMCAANNQVHRTKRVITLQEVP